MSTVKTSRDQEAWTVLHKFVERYVHFNDNEFKAWQSYFEIRTFDKKQIVTSTGEQEEYINIVVSGLARKYANLERGDVTMQIAPEGHMIHAEWSFHKRVPSNVIVETIEPTTFIAISYANYQALLDKFPKAEHMSRLFVTEMFIIKDRRYVDMVQKSTREVFLDYIQTHAHMLQRVPQKYLASYLNIKPETFSRLKHLLRTAGAKSI